jgi:hypothetical protein
VGETIGARAGRGALGLYQRLCQYGATAPWTLEARGRLHTSLCRAGDSRFQPWEFLAAGAENVGHNIHSRTLDRFGERRGNSLQSDVPLTSPSQTFRRAIRESVVVIWKHCPVPAVRCRIDHRLSVASTTEPSMHLDETQLADTQDLID